MQTKINFKLPVTVFKEGKYFIAYSPVLDLATQATDFDVLHKRFNEAVTIFFEELIDLGTIATVLSNLGWKKIKNNWSAPIPISHEIREFHTSLVA
ncbi:MAG: hypothetical protein ABIJ03_02335 [Patescibacteria group bacterium]|nr:hypothetical protein [Patescibacteria group bacterium]